MPEDRAFHHLRVGAIDPLTEDAVALTFEVPDALQESYRRTHGQYVTVRSPLTGDDVGRDYSICTPVSSPHLRVAVKRLPDGAFSQVALERLRVGDTVEVSTPTGNFHTPLHPSNAKHYTCIAAGSGITPVLSVLTTALEVEPNSRVTLLYANRTHASTMFGAELRDLERRYPDRLAVHYFFSRETTDHPMFGGRLDPERMEHILDTMLPVDDVDEWFLCGPFAMVAALRKLLIARGAAKRNLHAEIFHVD